MAEDDDARVNDSEAEREKEQRDDGEKRLVGGDGAPVARHDYGRPDVILKVPTVEVDEIDLNVSELRARVSLHASVGELMALDVGADVSVDQVELSIKGVHAQAELEVHLDRVYDIVARTMATIDRNPDLRTLLIKPIRETLPTAARAAEEVVPALGEESAMTATTAVGDLGETVGAVVDKPEDAVEGGGAATTVPRTVAEQRGPGIRVSREIIPNAAVVDKTVETEDEVDIKGEVAPPPARDDASVSEPEAREARPEQSRLRSNGESFGKRVRRVAAKSARRVARRIRGATSKRRKRDEAHERR